MFSDQQKADLGAKLDKANVKKNPKGYDYVEGWHAIAEANRIFGYDGWDRALVSLAQVAEPYEVNGNKRVAYRATVRVTVRAGETVITRDGTGYGSGIGKDLNDAHESAVKEAETDAMKRALMTFGNPFGLALYDKQQTNVEKSESAAETAALNAVNACTSRKEILSILDRDKDKILALPNGGADRVRARANERLKAEFPKEKDAA